MSFLDALSFGPQITYPPTKPVNEPSPYASQEEWAAYRRQQAIIRDSNKMTPTEMESAATLDLIARGIGGGRGNVNPDPVNPDNPAPEMMQGGSGRGNVNPPVVEPGNPLENSILSQAFPEVFRKQPPTGEANTKGGVERVNARTSEHGVTAIERDGKVYMTNIGPDGKVNKGTGSPNSVLGNGMGAANQGAQPTNMSVPNVSADIVSTIDKLKATDDYAVARGLSGNLIQTIAAQRASLEQNAIQMAAAKFGIPQLEAELQKSVQADMADPKWYPGIGDSPITAKLRAEVGQAHINARQHSTTYLQTNTSYASLGAYEKMAQMEFDRIKSAAVRQEGLADRSIERRQYMEDQQKAAAEDQIATLTPEYVKRMIILNPSLGVMDGKTGKPDPVPMAKAMANKQMMEAVQAPADMLPVLAMERNPHAVALLSRLEAGRMTEQEVSSKLNEVVKLANDPEFHKRYATFKYPSDKKSADAYINAKTQAKVSTDAAGKAELRRQNLMDAMEIVRASQTMEAMLDVRKILPADGIYKSVMEESLKVTGNMSLQNVATALMKTAKDDTDRAAKKIMLSQDIQNAIKAMPASVFGKPDANKVQQALIEMTRTRWEAIQGFIDSTDATTFR